VPRGQRKRIRRGGELKPTVEMGFRSYDGAILWLPGLGRVGGLRSRGVRGTHEWRSRRPVLARVKPVPHPLMQGCRTVLADH